jgi:hypothetical protein
MQNNHASPPLGGHEETDAKARPLLLFGAILAAIILAVALLMWITFKYFANEQSLGAPPTPFALGRLLPPEPRLQPDPRVDLNRLRTQQQDAISSYGWVNPTDGVIRIPVDRAMDRLVEKGLTVQTEAEQKKEEQKK